MKPKTKKAESKMVKLKPAQTLLDELDGNGQAATATLEESETPSITEADLDTINAAQNEVAAPPPVVHKITVPMPAECQTAVELLFLQIVDPAAGPELVWTTGFRVQRSYDSEPYDQANEELPDLDASEEDSYLDLGSAIIAAADQAGWWITMNGGTQEQDPNCAAAEIALDDWKREIEPENCTESMFDEDPEDIAMWSDIMAKQKAEREAREGAEAPIAETKADDTETKPPRDETMIVTDEAQKDFDQRKSRLEEIIGRLAIESTHLKASVKANRDSTKDYTEELEKHILRGPERLPLFELQERERMNAKKAEEAKAKEEAKAEKPRDLSHNEGAQVANRVAAGELQAAAEAWRATRLADLAGLTPKIVEILDGENIRTLGDWVDFPGRRGIEYTQIKNAAGKITETRLEKIAAAVNAAVVGT